MNLMTEPAMNEESSSASRVESHEIDHHHVRKHVRAYITVGIALLALTGLTVGLAFVDYGNNKAMEMGVAILVAIVKAGLVAYIFMHLNSERPLIYRVLIFTTVFVIALFVLTLFAFQNDIPAKL